MKIKDKKDDPDTDALRPTFVDTVPVETLPDLLPTTPCPEPGFEAELPVQAGAPAGMPVLPVAGAAYSVFPPNWRGPCSGAQFRVERHPHGVAMIVEIPSEFNAMITSLHTDGLSMGALAHCYDLGIAVASDPDRFSSQEIQANVLDLSQCAEVFRVTAQNMRDEFKYGDLMFRPDQVRTIAHHTGRSADALTAAADRIVHKVRTSCDPAILAALDASNARRPRRH